jgi:hypothetical protein
MRLPTQAKLELELELELGLGLGARRARQIDLGRKKEQKSRHARRSNPPWGQRPPGQKSNSGTIPGSPHVILSLETAIPTSVALGHVPSFPLVVS